MQPTSTEHQFTPGPWEVIRPGHRERRVKGRVFTFQTGPLVAEVQTSWDDATLIAAAPEMYAALKDVAEYFPVAPRPAFVDRLLAVIAKAEGRDS